MCLRCLQREMATDRHWYRCPSLYCLCQKPFSPKNVSLWRDPDDVSHCQILSPDKTEWWLISATLCGWGRCFVADQLWLMKLIREEEVVSRRVTCNDMIRLVYLCSFTFLRLQVFCFAAALRQCTNSAKACWLSVHHLLFSYSLSSLISLSIPFRGPPHLVFPGALPSTAAVKSPFLLRMCPVHDLFLFELL